MLYQFFFSRQVKGISNKYATYELPRKLTNELQLKILGN